MQSIYTAYSTYRTQVTLHIRREILSALKIDLCSITVTIKFTGRKLVIFSLYTTRGLLLINREIKVLKKDGECEIEITMKNKNKQLFLYIYIYIVTIIK